MKIKSNFKDYYDACFYSEFTSELQWTRILKCNEPHPELESVISGHLYTRNSLISPRSQFLVYVNGKYTLGLKFNENNYVYNLIDFQKYLSTHYPDSRFSADKKEAIRWFEKNLIEFEKIKDRLPMLNVPIQFIGRTHVLMSQENVDTSLKQVIHAYVASSSNFRYEYEYNYKCLAIDNMKLSCIQFYKVMSADIIAQEINMYLLNKVNPENNTVIIADKDRIVQHGFDLKQSFRKRKA